MLFAEEFFYNYKAYRNQEDAEQRVKGHAGNYGVTHGYTRTCARAGCSSRG